MLHLRETQLQIAHRQAIAAISGINAASAAAILDRQAHLNVSSNAMACAFKFAAIALDETSASSDSDPGEDASASPSSILPSTPEIPSTEDKSASSEIPSTPGKGKERSPVLGDEETPIPTSPGSEPTPEPETPVSTPASAAIPTPPTQSSLMTPRQLVDALDFDQRLTQMVGDLLYSGASTRDLSFVQADSERRTAAFRQVLSDANVLKLILPLPDRLSFEQIARQTHGIVFSNEIPVKSEPGSSTAPASSPAGV